MQSAGCRRTTKQAVFVLRARCVAMLPAAGLCVQSRHILRVHPTTTTCTWWLNFQPYFEVHKCSFKYVLPPIDQLHFNFSKLVGRFLPAIRRDSARFCHAVRVRRRDSHPPAQRVRKLPVCSLRGCWLGGWCADVQRRVIMSMFCFSSSPKHQTQAAT